jgi:hypothetical protein
VLNNMQIVLAVGQISGSFNSSGETIPQNTMNEYKTSDIRISKDSAGYYNASHKHQGSLYEMCYFNDRNEARRAAVEDLMRIKEFGKSDAYDIHNDY